MSLRRFVGFAAVLLAPLALRPHGAAAQQTDVIRGRVTGPDSLPIEGGAQAVRELLARMEEGAPA